MEYENRFDEFEDMENNFPKVVKIAKKKKFSDEEPLDWKKTRKTKRWQWHGNRNSIRSMDSEL